MVNAQKNLLQGQGWIVAPFESYINKVEKISLSLPYKVKVPITDDQFQRMFGFNENIKWIVNKQTFR